MSAAMHAAALRLPWQRARRGSPWISASILLVLPVAAGLIGARIGLPAATLAGLTVLGALVTLWYLQVDGWLNQNLPLLARQLPGQLRVLRLQLLGGGLVMALLAAAVLAGFSERPAAQWLPVTALVVLLLAWLARFPWLWVLAGFPPLGFKAIERALQAAMAEEAAVGFALALLLAGLWPVMGAGGRLHRWASAGALRWRAAALAQQKGEPVPAMQRAALWERIARVFAWPLHAWRRRLLRRATPANALARLDVVLMGSAHWTVLVWSGLLLLLSMGLILGWVSIRLGEDWTEILRNMAGLGIGIGAIALAGTTNLSSRLLRTRREQAVLVLLPGPPSGAALGLALRRRWLAQALASLAVVMPAILALLAISRPELGRMVGGYLAVLSFAPLLVLQDESRLTAGKIQRVTLIMVTAAIAAMGSYLMPWPAWLPPLLALPVAAAALAWRWRATRDLPAQLPAGRAA